MARNLWHCPDYGAAPIEIFAKTLRKRYRKQWDIGAAKLEAALVERLLRLARIGRR
ncbi:hypothetical protein GUK34_36095 [Rhizobium leguminosarum]|uniref:hypothetical protein n=1 Tax=Rhizobium ruizarguesonis TaxID=2081791 RepID=UPI0013BBD7B3|nr:hypothetical protein [Rhizobium ruizarguesonis]NEI10215.1 hypothetical protein [Rhizobium ruizarguesonis]